jgi:hypothetical protein
MQAAVMFVGEALCYGAFIFYKKKRSAEHKQNLEEARAKGLKTSFNIAWLLIPTFGDFLTSTLQYIALNFISPSVYQMLRGGVIVITAAA